MSALVPPSCIDTASSRGGASLMNPPGMTCQPPLPSAMANTRSMAAREPMRPPPRPSGSQHGVCESGSGACSV